MEPPRDGGTKVCSNGPGHMTKMATMPIYGKKFKKIIFSGTKRLMAFKLGMQRRVLEYYQVCSNNDLYLFYGKVKFAPLCFRMGKKVKHLEFSEIILVYDIKVGRCSQLNEYMNLYEYQRSRSFIDLCPRSLRFNIFKLLFLKNH